MCKTRRKGPTSCRRGRHASFFAPSHSTGSRVFSISRTFTVTEYAVTGFFVFLSAFSAVIPQNFCWRRTVIRRCLGPCPCASQIRNTKINGFRFRPVPRTFLSWLVHSNVFVFIFDLLEILSFDIKIFGRPRSSSNLQSSVEQLFCLKTVILGNVKVAVHLINEASCFVHFIFSFPKVYKLVFEPRSISSFLVFRPWPHFPLRTLLATLVPNVFLFFYIPRARPQPLMSSTCTTFVCVLLQMVGKLLLQLPHRQLRGTFWFSNLVPRFHSILWVLKTITSSIVTARNNTPIIQFHAPNFFLMLGSTFWHPLVVFQSPAQTQFAQSNMDNIRLQVLQCWVWYLSNLPRADPHARGKFGSHPSFFFLLSSDLVNHRHCVGEHGFRLDFRAWTTHVHHKVYHPQRFPRILQCVFSHSCAAFGVFFTLSKTFSRLFPSCFFPAFSILARLSAQLRSAGLPNTSSGAVFPKHHCLSLLPWHLPRAYNHRCSGTLRSTRHTTRGLMEAQGGKTTTHGTDTGRMHQSLRFHEQRNVLRADLLQRTLSECESCQKQCYKWTQSHCWCVS